MKEFKKGYLDDDWEENTRREVLGMSQATNTFWDYAVSLQSKNSLLRGTPSHLSDEQICHQLEAGMENCLSKKIGGEKVNKILDFRKWLNEVKRYDDLLRDAGDEYECIAKESREASRHANTTTEPLCCIPNTNNHHASSNASTSAAPSNAPHKQCPALLQSEHQLLKDNDGCLKCHCLFVNHCAANCPNNFPSPVNYRTLTQADVDHSKHNRGNKTVTEITTSASSVPSTSGDTLEDAPTHTSSTQHHIAAVMGMSRNLVAYAVTNASNVISRSDSDSSSEPASFPGVSKDPSSVTTPKVSPLHTPHLYWCCLMSSKNQEFRGDPVVTLQCYLDNSTGNITMCRGIQGPCKL